jgi:hypothetical protein
MAPLNSGLANCLPLMTRLIHVLLTPSFLAIAILAPRGLSSKNSVSVMWSSSFGWFNRIIHHKK